MTSSKCWSIAALVTASATVALRGQACGWSSRDSIRVAGEFEYVYVEPPLTTMAGAKAMMIGGQAAQRSLAGKVRVQPSGNVFFAGLLLADTGRATSIQLPDSVAMFSYPRIAGLPDGSLVVVWQGGRTLGDTIASRLWTSTLEGGRWSPARLVGDWEFDPIGLTFASDLVVHGSEAALLARSGNSTFLLRRTGTAWQRFELPTGIPQLYPTLIATADGFGVGTVDQRGLVVTHVRRDGTEVRRVLVAADTGTGFDLPQLLASSDSDEVVAWVDDGFSERSVVRVARSHDAGVTWTEAASLTVNDGLQSLDAILRDGVLYVTGRQGGPWPFAAALRGNEWQVLGVPRRQDEIGIVPPRYSRVEKAVTLYWGVNFESRVDREPPILVEVRLGSGCRP
jgi:hypothetical protein